MREYKPGIELRDGTSIYWNGGFVCYVNPEITEEEVEIYEETLAEFERSGIKATGVNGRKLLFEVINQLTP